MEQQQLPLQLTTNESALRRFFENAVRKPVQLVFNNNATRMLSFRARGEAIVLRLSRVFLSAPAEVLIEAASFIRKRGGPTPAMNRFLRSVSPAPAPRRRARAVTKGAHHDLKAAFERVNAEYFGGSVEASITWSRRQQGRVRRRTLGSFCARSSTVRINPVLDKPEVPELFLDFIVYHEMLHSVVEIKEKGGKTVVHSREFRVRERMFRGYEEASRWEKANRALL